MRRTSTIMAGVVAGLLATGAHANVIYNFHADADSTQTPLAQVIGGQLEITDAAYRSGSVDVVYNQPPVFDDPAISPILNVSFDVDPIPVGIRPRGPLLQRTNIPFTASLNFDDSGSLSGAMDFSESIGVVKASGSGTQWRVFDYGSDKFANPETGCSGDNLCDIGTGYWQVDPATIPADVPEPSTWALFGLAVLGLFGMTRKRLMR